MKTVFVLVTIFILPCMALQRLRDSRARPRVRHAVENDQDMAFIATLVVSGQEVHPIVDTGSFELVLFEAGCDGCSDTRTYFNPRVADDTFKKLTVEGTENYGSGRTFSKASVGTLQVRDGLKEHLHGDAQLFWLANQVDLNFEVGSEFGGIFGLGPPASAVDFAVANAKYIKEAVLKMGPNITTESQEHPSSACRRQSTTPWLRRSADFWKFLVATI